MNNRTFISVVAILGMSLTLINSCSNKANNDKSTVADVVTTPVSSITQTTAIGGGNIISDGGSAITARGVCWSTNNTPTIIDSKTIDGTGSGSFTSPLTGLTGNTAYYIRAYATNGEGTGYGRAILFTTQQVAGDTVTDNDGNIYHIVTIGTQVWMIENLKTTTFNDGVAIPNVTNTTAWFNLTTSAYCWYNNDATTNKTTYGALYNWYAVNSGKLCPVGWHVPTDAEWTVLSTYLGGESVAGGKLKETGTIHWLSPNFGADNSTGFTAVPGGRRVPTFVEIGSMCYFWAATALDSGNALSRQLFSVDAYCNSGMPGIKTAGQSVRCIKD
jgi:uncharacterized protein (TIGR02145 family)